MKRQEHTQPGKLALLSASSAADKAWMSEIAFIFGKPNAGLARFQGRAQGEPGTRLRALYDTYVAARDAYFARR